MACPPIIQPTNATALAWGKISRAGPGNAPGSPTACGEQAVIIYAMIGVTVGAFLLGFCICIFCTCRKPREGGPRITASQPRRSRVNGVAQVVLKALPVVRFGITLSKPAKELVENIDLESNDSRESGPANIGATGSVAVELFENHKSASESIPNSTAQSTAPGAAATQYDSSVECSICTEDYFMGEEVRVLPCNHKFHPECVDPWLLNVSGTCPLCRLDLHERNAEDNDGVPQRLPASINSEPTTHSPAISVTEAWEAELPTPSERLTSLSRVTFGTLAGHIAALRQHRRQRMLNLQIAAEAGSRTLTSRLRARFKIKTLTWHGRTEDSPGEGA